MTVIAMAEIKQISDIFLPSRCSEWKAGSEAWWVAMKQIGLPIVENSASSVFTVLHFYWKPPKHRCVKAVVLDVNCITNHYDDELTQLSYFSEGNLWYGSVLVPKTWTGSYAFIPVNEIPSVITSQESNGHISDGGSGVTVSESSEHLAKRERWKKLMPFAQADIYNNQAVAGLWASNRSAVFLPPEAANVGRSEGLSGFASAQSFWREHEVGRNDQGAGNSSVGSDMGVATPTYLAWRSEALKRFVDVWHYTPNVNQCTEKAGNTNAKRSLVLVLDGRSWIHKMPVIPVLEQLATDGELQPSSFVFIDSGKSRAKDYSCNKDFWLSIQNELIPLIKTELGFPENDETAISVAGYSLGGLAALYAGLRFPSVFSNVISMSGSFWWPNPDIMRSGSLSTSNDSELGDFSDAILEAFCRNHHLYSLAKQNVKIRLSVGTQESVLSHLNFRVHDKLVSAGFNTVLTDFPGGHDLLCWRAEFVSSLLLLQREAAELQLKSVVTKQLDAEKSLASCGG